MTVLLQRLGVCIYDRDTAVRNCRGAKWHKYQFVHNGAKKKSIRVCLKKILFRFVVHKNPAIDKSHVTLIKVNKQKASCF